MGNLYCDIEIEQNFFESTFLNVFPNTKLLFWDKDENDSLNGIHSSDITHYFYSVDFDTAKIEFRFCIELYSINKENELERDLYLGKKLSETLEQRILVPFSLPEKPYSPYYDIIFDRGKTLLADDCDTNFADNSLNYIKIIGEYNLPETQFDTKGRLIR